MASRVEKNQKKRKFRWLYWVGGILLILLISALGYGFYLYQEVNETAEEIHEPLERDQANPERKEQIENTLEYEKTLNILLLGVDERADDSGRSDTMIVLSANPQTDSMLMLSIPRDTYTNIPGVGMDKINHAYAFGGTDLALETVENTFDIPIHFYAKVNMEGFEDGIDAINGVTVTNDFAFKQDGETFPEGELQLNGEEALKYVRMRKEDPQGDLGRNERQRQVIEAAMDKAANFSNISKIGNILEIIGDNVRTDMKMSNIRTIYSGYQDTRKDIETLEIEGTGQTLEDGIWYYMVPDEEFNRLQTKFKEHMDAS
ncbi:LCP family protein [Sediminibacillus massiliensis]|uniref:LCP family glycopolymer transferase n=1 Tax=Sediminibacillus massiliensis TaxID=1926277 RepID=UPI00098861E8|nr:LCP family protein [Sediminibacillus massiliensis]